MFRMTDPGVIENLRRTIMPRTVTLLTYNIDTNILRTEEGYARDAFPEWRAGARAPFIMKNLEKIIKQEHPDIIQIQEARKFTTKFGDRVDSVTYLVDFFHAQGYEVLVQPYNQTGERSFQFITAYQPKTFELETSYIRYLTKTPETPTPRPSIEEKSADEKQAIISQIKSHNFGVEWERGVFITGLRDLETKELIFSFNVHLDIPLDCRMKSSALVVSFVKEIIEKSPGARVLLSGDFNSFPDWGGDEQIKLLSDAILDGQPLLGESTKDLTLSNGEIINFSFMSPPYDFAANEKRLNMTQALAEMPPKERREKIMKVYETECQSLGGKLDHMFFSRGLEPIKTALIPAPTSDEVPTSYHEREVKEFIIRRARERQEAAFASDHQPICSTFQYK